MAKGLTPCASWCAHRPGQDRCSYGDQSRALELAAEADAAAAITPSRVGRAAALISVAKAVGSSGDRTLAVEIAEKTKAAAAAITSRAGKAAALIGWSEVAQA